MRHSSRGHSDVSQEKSLPCSRPTKTWTNCYCLHLVIMAIKFYCYILIWSHIGLHISVRGQQPHNTCRKHVTSIIQNISTIFTSTYTRPVSCVHEQKAHDLHALCMLIGGMPANRHYLRCSWMVSLDLKPAFHQIQLIRTAYNQGLIDPKGEEGM